MRILFISYHYWPPHFGGELKISIERFESLVKRGHQVTVLTSGVPGLPARETQNGIEIRRSPIVHDSRLGRGCRRLLFPLWAETQMKSMDFDLIHYGGMGGISPLHHYLGMARLNRLADRKGVKKVLVHSLADSETEALSTRGSQARWRNRTLRQMDAIVSVSPALQEGVQRLFPRTARLILCGVHEDIFVPLSETARAEIRNRNEVKNGEVVFSFLGSVGRRKGFDLLIAAFLSLAEQFPNWHLWIVGPKTSEESQNIDDCEIDELIRPLADHAQRVHFWGRVDDRKELAGILGASDVFVFPSRKEGMPLAPLEAMAAGVPVIISRIPGVTDLASLEGKTGYYIAVNEAQALKSAMIKLAEQPELRAEMGRAARQRIEDQFRWEKHVSEWESFYSSLLQSK
ncbi:MAG: glycosyltransferase family 4 protein [Anaerolineaceae bacterium]|nr:glycosyltransferase family 4 protein [Anaerolineaceae bacterium]